jgi:hypothetical protein
VSRRLFFRPEVYQPQHVVSITGAFDVIAYFFGAFENRTGQLAVLTSDLLAGGTCAVLIVVWQRNLRRHIRMLELHLRTRQVMQGKIRDSLTILVALAEKHRGESLALDKDIQLSIDQLRSIERRVAFDPTVLIDLEDYDAMCA